jgi:hypothetical protein
MCLQWCHVRSILVDNDIPCSMLCPDTIRLAQAEKNCRSCTHCQPGDGCDLCLLTHEITPLAENCCHWNAAIEGGEVLLVLGKTVSKALAKAHGVESTAQIFEMVDTAPELEENAPEEGIPIRIEELSVPLVYGLIASAWDEALYPSIS